MDGRRDGIEDAVAAAEDWEDLAARLADWDLTATGGRDGIVIRTAGGGPVIGICAHPPTLAPAEAHFAG